MKRDAPVAARMIMPTLERLARLSEQKRSRRHHVEPELAPMLKRPGHHRRDGHGFVDFLEAPVAWTRRANDIGDPPSVATRESPRPRFGGGAKRRATCQSTLEIERNFSQDRATSAG